MSEGSDFLSFRKMITPIIIQIIFWVGVIVCVIGGIVYIVMGVVSRTGGLAVLYGILILVLGPLAVRVECELLILVFRIHDALEEINDKIVRQQQP